MSYVGFVPETQPFQMATRSRIGLELSDGSILSVYCHWDGYPEFNGVKLQEHFNSYDAAAELIDGGDVSALWTNEGWNKEYLADREDYAYLFKDGEWVCYDTKSWSETYQQQVKIPVAVTV